MGTIPGETALPADAPTHLFQRLTLEYGAGFVFLVRMSAALKCALVSSVSVGVVSDLPEGLILAAYGLGVMSRGLRYEDCFYQTFLLFNLLD